MFPSEFNPERVARQRYLQREADLREAVELSEARGARVDVFLVKHPKVKAIVKKAFPDYRRKVVRFHVGNNQSVELDGGYWSGGSRTEWFGLRSSGERFPLTYPTNPPQYGGGKVPTVQIKDNQLVVRGGSFSSKPVVLTFYVTDKVARLWGVEI